MCNCSECLPFVGPVKGATGPQGPQGNSGTNGSNGVAIIDATLSNSTSTLTSQWNTLSSYTVNNNPYVLNSNADSYRITAFLSTANSGSTTRKVRANLTYQSIGYGPLGGSNAEFVLANNRIHKIIILVTRVTSGSSSNLSCSLEITYNGILQDNVEWSILNVPFPATSPFSLEIEGYHGSGAGDSVTLTNAIVEYLSI